MTRITLYEFNSLPDAEQHLVLNNEGTFLDAIPAGETRYMLFGLEKFFVELEFDVPSNSLKSFRTFKTGKLLDKYLDLYKL